jgi:hypothetical protein
MRNGILRRPAQIGILNFFLVLLLLNIGLATLPAQALPASATPTMQVRVGFEGFYKQQAWLPIQVTLSLPENNPNFSGKLEASFGNFGADSLVIQRSVQVPAPGNRTVWLYLPTDNRNLTEVQIRLVDESRKPIAEDSKAIRSIGREDLLVGILSDESNSLSAIVNERFTKPFNAGSSLLNARVPGRVSTATIPVVRVTRLSPTDLPPDVVGWESLDGLAISDSGTFNLADQSYNTAALKNTASTWLAQGRFLFVAGDNTLRRSGFLADMLPVKPAAAPQTRSFPAAFSRFIEQGEAPPARVLLAEITLTPGAKALASEGNLPVLAERDFGLGKSLFLATDFRNLPPLMNRNIWQEALSNYEPRYSHTTEHRQVYEAYRPWGNQLMPPAQLNTLPDISWVFFTLALYVFVIAITYFILKKFNRRELGWFIAPLFAVLLTVGLYTAGELTVGDPITLSRLTVIRAGELTNGQLAGSTTALATVYTNRRTDVELDVAEDSNAVPLYLYSPTLALRGTVRNPIWTYGQGADGGFGRIFMGLSDQRSFVAQRNTTPNLGSGFKMDINKVQTSLSGTLENTTGSDWIDVAVWATDTEVYKIPIVKAGEKIDLTPNLQIKNNEMLSMKLSSYNPSFSARRTGTLNYREQQYFVATTLVGDKGEALPSDPNRIFLVAWQLKSGDDFPIKVPNVNATKVDMTVLFQMR